MAEEGGTEVAKKSESEDEERRLRERLKRRKEDRSQSRSQSQNKQPRRRHHARGGPPPIRGPPPPYGYYDHRRGRQGPGPGPRDWRGGPPSSRPHNAHPPRSYESGSTGRGRPPPRRDDRWNRRSRSYSRSRSRSRGRSRSRSSSRSSGSSYSSSDEESRSRSRSSGASHSSRSRSSSVSSSSSASAPDHQEDPDAYALTKDQRTVFVSQLVMRANERDVRRYFRKAIGVKVNAVAMLRDKRTGRHKGFCYVELARLEDVVKAVSVNNQQPDFQRFPILIKPSEAEKNYTVPTANTLTASMMGVKTAGGPVVGPNGKLVEAQKAYVGNLDPSVTQEHIFSLFSSFGTLEKVMLQTEPTTGASKGFAFLSYRDAKDANLAIQTMAGQTVAGRSLKTGWANQTSTVPNVEVVTSYEFPDDAPTRIQNAHLALAQLAGSGLTNVAPLVPATDIAATAEAALNAALGLTAMPTAASMAVSPQGPVGAKAPPESYDAATTTNAAESAAPQGTAPDLAKPTDAKVIDGANNPTNAILVRNMFDKDQETEPNWEEEIRLDFEEECSKYGKITKVVVMSKEPGGKIYALFETVEQAKMCASALAGRWFDKRQLRVEFVSVATVDSASSN